MTDFLAHSYRDPSDPSQDRDELLEKHLNDVANLGATFAAQFDAADWGYFAGLWHDLGKYKPEFQRRVRGENIRVVHSTPGAQHADAHCPKGGGRILAYCIAGHHGGLPDAIDAETGGHSGLNDRLAKDVPSLDGAPSKLLETPQLSLPGLDWGQVEADRSFRLSVFCRVLFSCLVDADFLSTERFMRPDRAALRPTDSALPADLLTHLNAYLAKLEARSDSSPVNASRREVLDACRRKAVLPPGLFSLTVPTGGGKTLSSLAFALTHAAKYDLQRVIYAIPFTSIIEQTAKVFRKALSEAGHDVVLEHHSNFERKENPRDEIDDRETFFDWLAAENWDAPLVVTTNVQLFESLFSNRPSRCRKLHRIAKSVIVLDEVQTLPVELLRPTLAMLDELCRNYGCSVVLCSATQPALALRDGFPIGLPNVREIIDDAPALFAAMKRVQVKQIGHIEDADLACRLKRHEQVLCVVNTRAHAARIFRLLKDLNPDHVFHLSASMCAAHRSDMLEEIRLRLDPSDPKPCVVISTQLVEAGVDIDFPAVYRAMTGIDSLTQAAGRCNREGRWDVGYVYVFDTHVNPRGDLRRRRDFGMEIALLHDDLLGLEAVEHYFRLLYWSKQDEWDKHGVLKCFSYDERGLHAQFREAASKYRFIRDEQQPVIVPYGQRGKRLIEELTSMREPPGRSFSRRAQRFTVGVYPYQLERLHQATLVELYHERYWVLEDPAAYDQELGLRTDLT